MTFSDLWHMLMFLGASHSIKMKYSWLVFSPQNQAGENFSSRLIVLLFTKLCSSRLASYTNIDIYVPRSYYMQCRNSWRFRPFSWVLLIIYGFLLQVAAEEYRSTQRRYSATPAPQLPIFQYWNSNIPKLFKQLFFLCDRKGSQNTHMHFLMVGSFFKLTPRSWKLKTHEQSCKLHWVRQVKTLQPLLYKAHKLS